MTPCGSALLLLGSVFITPVIGADLEAASGKMSLIPGGETFQARCAVCHGSAGRGDGRMAAVINDPPPFNLTRSVLANREMLQIITEGGEAVGRSSKMPPWKKELSEAEIASVMSFVRTLRASDIAQPASNAQAPLDKNGGLIKEPRAKRAAERS